MNKLLLIITTLLLLTSCGKSDEERLNDMVAETIKSNLYIPDSYDPVSLQVDSMSRNVITDANIRKAAKFVELMNEAKSIQRDIDMNEEQRDYWRGKYGEFYSDYSKKVQRGIEKRDKKISEAKSLFTDIYSQYTSPREFCGYIADHKYRAKNNMGNVMFGEAVILLDKNKENITAIYDAEKEEFLYFLQLTGAMQELGDDVNPDTVDLMEVSDNIKSKYELLLQ